MLLGSPIVLGLGYTWLSQKNKPVPEKEAIRKLDPEENRRLPPVSIKDVNDPKGFYSRLQIKKNVTSLEITKAYRKLALTYHPDKNRHPGAEETFKELLEAYETLRDGTLRSDYDNQENYSSTHLSRPTFLFTM